MVARLLIAILLALYAGGAVGKEGDFFVLCYHDVPEKYNGDPMAVSTQNFVSQLAWLRSQGYKSVTVNDLLAAQNKSRKLPDKAFLITVDDGYRSFYTHVFPVLKLYGYHAVLAIVGRWIEDPLAAKKTSDDKYFRREQFVTWPEVREMAASGLVEIASHSYDLHHGITANPEGNVEPAAVTLAYDPVAKRYETVGQLRLRVRKDLQRNADLIEQHLGKRPRVMVWPYGAYNQIDIQEAIRAGTPITFALDDRMANVADLHTTHRILISKEPPLDTFTYTIGYINRKGYATSEADPRRVVITNLDEIYDPDPRRQNEKLGKFLDEIQMLGVNTVYLRPYVESKTGVGVREVYFPNRVLPMRGDIANRVAWQLQSRLDVAVYALMPVDGFDIDGKAKPAPDAVVDLFSDLAAHVPVSGIVFEGIDADSAEAGADGIRNKLALAKRLRDKVKTFRPRDSSYFSGIAVTQFKKPWRHLDDIFNSDFDFVLLDTGFDPALLSIKADKDHRALEKTIFALSSPRKKPLSGYALLRQVQILERHGARHFAVASNAVSLNSADGLALKLALSTRTNPYEREP